MFIVRAARLTEILALPLIGFPNFVHRLGASGTVANKGAYSNGSMLCLCHRRSTPLASY